MGEKAQVLPSPLPVTPGLQQRRRTARGAGWPRWRRLWGAHGTVSFTIQPNLCDPGDAGDSAGSRELWQEPSATNPNGAASSALQPALPWAGSQTQAGAPSQESMAFACWLFSPAFWDPSPPSQGSRASGSVCRATHGEPAATGWTVFVNLLETSQHSPELHLLHALKLTVQATRMTLTDLVQYHVF